MVQLQSNLSLTPLCFLIRIRVSQPGRKLLYASFPPSPHLFALPMIYLFKSAHLMDIFICYIGSEKLHTPTVSETSFFVF